jgi:two-component system cell cycle response regulator CpdR
MGLRGINHSSAWSKNRRQSQVSFAFGTQAAIVAIGFQMNKTGNKGYRILVVDDEDSVCKAIKMMLEFDGHKVETAESAERALTAVKDDKFDLIITDYSMGDMKGDRMATEIRQLHPQQPIIMVTAFADDFLKAGKPTVEVNEVVNKPFSLNELRAAITKVMG